MMIKVIRKSQIHICDNVHVGFCWCASVTNLCSLLINYISVLIFPGFSVLFAFLNCLVDFLSFVFHCQGRLHIGVMFSL